MRNFCFGLRGRPGILVLCEGKKYDMSWLKKEINVLITCSWIFFIIILPV